MVINRNGVTAGYSESSDFKLIPRTVLAQMRLHGWTIRACGALCGLYGGIIAPVAGSLLTAIAWLTGPKWHELPLQRGGAILLFLTIPLLVFGAHCLDLIDKQNEEAKKHRFGRD